MARDNHPKERQRKQLERKQNQRASYDRILIVSEGSKTEPLYFEEIRAKYRLYTANIEIQPSVLGTEPIQVVNYARQLFEKGDRHKNIRSRSFEQVYAVFDRDQHITYFKALHFAKSLDGKLLNDSRQPVKFCAIASVPCFELWLLLHFEDIQHPLHRDEVLYRLKHHIHGYEKGAGSVFAKTYDRLNDASKRAQLLAHHSNPFIDTEPFTDVVVLVNLLTTLQPLRDKS